MTHQRKAIARRTAALVVIAVIIVAAIGVAVFTQRLLATCNYSAEPIALAVSVVADTNQTPAAGADVAATNTPFVCNGAPATPRETVTFVTNNSHWHYLASVDDSGYAFTVGYSGHTYNFSTNLGIEEATCVTLFVPSGRTNVTFESFQSACPPKPIVTSTTTSSASESPQLYQLEFVQESNCAYGSWLVPWGVVLDNHTIMVQPSNATFPLTYRDARLTSDSNYSTIWFSVPNGTYSYTVLPNNFYGIEQSGTATVDGGNVEVQISAFITAMGCASY